MRKYLALVLASHVHAYARGKWGKTRFIMTGGAGAPLSGPKDSKHYFYNYVKVTVTPKGVSYKTVRM